MTPPKKQYYFFSKNFSLRFEGFFSFLNITCETSDVSWMDTTTTAIVKVAKYKSGPFELAESMSKRPAGFVYIGNIVYYLTNLPNPFPRGLEIDLEGSSRFPTVMLLMLINRLSLFYYL